MLGEAARSPQVWLSGLNNLGATAPVVAFSLWGVAHYMQVYGLSRPGVNHLPRDDRELGEPAPAGRQAMEGKPVAQVEVAGETGRARAATAQRFDGHERTDRHIVDPGAYGDHPAADLVAEHNRGAGPRQRVWFGRDRPLPIEDLVQISPAQAVERHLQLDLARPRLRFADLAQPEIADAVIHSGPHRGRLTVRSLDRAGKDSALDLTLTADQAALVDAFGAFLAKESPPEVVRAAEPLGHDPALWAKAVAMGVTTLGTPEAAGGDGGSMLDLALVAELVGRHLAPIPYVEAAVTARLLARCSASAWLERAHSGMAVALALRPPRDGVARLVPGGAVAGAVIAVDGHSLVLVPGGSEALANVAASPLADRAIGPGAEVLASGPSALALHQTAVMEWRVLTAAALSGLASKASEIGVAYAKQREQFGKPIAAFQSIAHRLADDATDTQGLQLLARKAAWAVDEEPASAGRLASMAYLWGGEVANRVTGNSLHFHGGYGFMLEYDIQLYFRRAKLWSVIGGDPRHGYAELGRTLFGGPR
jgi:alkylation response protein AidB-like acyl-CoA dehydrogenase